MFLKRGHAYVYFTYGSCWCMNVSGELPGVGGGVLIRALEPLEGIDVMAERRGVSRLLDLARGPGRLAAALSIDRTQDGLDLCSRRSTLWLGASTGLDPVIGVTTRIGLSREAHRMLRFFDKGSPFVSGPRRLLK
jgi:DNA-3-methyladenine glycosylase